MENTQWFQNLQESAEVIGGQVYLISNLVVDYTRPLKEAAMAGGPQTPSDSGVLNWADNYQLFGNKAEETIVLFSWKNSYKKEEGDPVFRSRGNYQEAVEWGLLNGLLKTTPHVPFAIGEQMKNFDYKLGFKSMNVVETTGCTFEDTARACGVWWNHRELRNCYPDYCIERVSLLHWQSDFNYYFCNDTHWLSFRKSH